MADVSTGCDDDDIEYWNNRWRIGWTPWHELDVNAGLLHHYDELVDNRERLQIFVPLCGKTVDLKWLAEKGHTVVGVDCSPLALESFFNENALEFIREPLSKLNGFLYKCTTLPISLYCCDILQFDKVVEERFDVVWDCSSLIAIRSSDIQRYMEIMHLLISDTCRYLLKTFEYDKSVGRPLALPASFLEDDVCDLFGNHFNCEKLSTVLDEEKHKRIAPESLYFRMCYWLLVRK